MIENISEDNAASFLDASLRFKEKKLYEIAFKYIL